MRPELNDANVINIFTDASISYYEQTGCSGYEAYRENILISRDFRLLVNSTNNQSEAYAVYMGVKYVEYLIENNLLNGISFINLLSDSKITVYGLREWIHKWINNIQYIQPMQYMEEYPVMISSSAKPVANQSIIVDILSILIPAIESLNKHGIMFNIYHTNGHGTKSEKAINNYASSLFKYNNINTYYYIPNDDSIVSIIDKNNSVDNYTREILNGAFIYEGKMENINHDEPPNRDNLMYLCEVKDKLKLIKGKKEVKMR